MAWIEIERDRVPVVVLRRAHALLEGKEHFWEAAAEDKFAVGAVMSTGMMALGQGPDWRTAIDNAEQTCGVLAAFSVLKAMKAAARGNQEK